MKAGANIRPGHARPDSHDRRPSREARTANKCRTALRTSSLVVRSFKRRRETRDATSDLNPSKPPFFDNPEAQTSSLQKTAEAEGCISPEPAPRISVSALLELARWCRQRHEEPPGGEPCLSSPAGLSPPASCGGAMSASPRSTLGSTDGRDASATLPPVQRHAEPQAAPTHIQGGDA
jgi:hypothetical protein